jgi:xanthine/uracil/vitamin C permease (AzgA family)
MSMDMDKRLYAALTMYAVLAFLVWLTMSDVSVPVGEGAVSIRGLTWAILAFFAVRTWLHWRAEQARVQRERRQFES